MNIVSILGLGAVGLGFLLAFLAYRLLDKPHVKERAVYIYMLFCLMLVVVGASIQYSDNTNRTALEQKARDFENLSSNHQSTLSANEAQAERTVAAMKAIAETLTPALQPLRDVNSHVSNGEVCNGGKHGKPLPGAQGDVNNISLALEKINAPKRLAESYLPPQ